jgi:hypothetical protein
VGKGCFAGVWRASASRFETWFGPQGAGKNELSSLSRDLVETTKAGNGTPQVAPSATSNSRLCPQPRRGRKRAVGIRYRLERFRRRNSGGRAPLLAAISAGFAGNPQCTLSLWKFLSQSFAHLARPRRAGKPRGRLSPSGAQILPSPGEREVGKANFSTETCFSCVKSFSYPKTWL